MGCLPKPLLLSSLSGNNLRGWQLVGFFPAVACACEENRLSPGGNGEEGEESFISRVRDLATVFLK